MWGSLRLHYLQCTYRLSAVNSIMHVTALSSLHFPSCFILDVILADDAYNCTNSRHANILSPTVTRVFLELRSTAGEAIAGDGSAR